MSAAPRFVASADRVRVLLVDDHAVVRVGFRSLLAQQPWCGDIDEAASGETGYQMFRDLAPDVVVMDLSMPRMSGLTAIQRITAVAPGARILAVSVHDEAVFVMQALKAGAAGYVSKGSAPEELVDAVRAVSRGQSYISAGIAQRIAITSLRGGEDPFSQLSPREFEIVTLAARGADPRDIALRLSINYKTVVNYLTQAKRKLMVANTTEMTRLAIRHGIVEVGRVED